VITRVTAQLAHLRVKHAPSTSGVIVDRETLWMASAAGPMVALSKVMGLMTA
jgi:hypothetical protein